MNKNLVHHPMQSYTVRLQMKSFLLFVILLIPSDGRIFSPDIERDIRSFTDASMKCHHIPGMTLSVVKGKLFVCTVRRN